MSKSTKNIPLISDNDIESRDLKRRSFLKGIGMLTGVSTFLGLAAAGCKDDPVEPESDDFDFDPTDQSDTD